MIEDITTVNPKHQNGDWYLFENHTILRIYGFEDEPYLLPTFLTPKIYALEFIRWRFATNYEHFAKYKKSITFNLPYKTGPFIARSGTSKTITKDLLKEMKFQKGEINNYYPHHIISEKRKQNKFYAYEHQSNPEMEKAINLESWEEIKQNLIGFEQFKKTK